MEDITHDDINVKVDRGDGFSLDSIHRTKHKTVFVKKALVYFSVLRGCFIDLETKEKYISGFNECTKGDLFVDVHKSRIPVKTLMDSNKTHYSKKKILKKYSEYKDCDNNECK